jgi:hypothetical protein
MAATAERGTTRASTSATTIRAAARPYGRSTRSAANAASSGGVVRTTAARSR